MAGVLLRFHLLTLSSLVCMSFTFLKSIRSSVQIFNLLKPFICSNSKIEGAFSTVSNIFSHKRLSMSHSTLNYNLWDIWKSLSLPQRREGRNDRESSRYVPQIEKANENK